MSRARIVCRVDAARTMTDMVTEQLLRAVNARVAPALSEQIGAVDYRRGDASGTFWSTEGWLVDGTYISLSVATGSNEVVLLVDTAPVLKRVMPPSAAQKLVLVVTTTAVALASWWHFRTLLSIAAGLVGGVALGTACEILVTMRKERRNANIEIDEQTWKERLAEAIALA